MNSWCDGGQCVDSWCDGGQCGVVGVVGTAWTVGVVGAVCGQLVWWGSVCRQLE